MKEELLQFAWQHKLFSLTDLSTDTNERIEIIDVGQLNHDSGPDFFNAKIKIDNTLWVGNIEVHAKSSEWYKHKHNTNKQYNNVILHVVQSNDKQTINEKNVSVPTLEIKVLPSLLHKYNVLLKQVTAIPCGKNINKITEIYLSTWFTSVLYEKLEKKYNFISELLLKNQNDWRETCYVLLAKNFGFKTNSEPFEMLSQSLPFNVILKHIDDKKQVEALLFGQAGFLDELIGEDDYYNALKKEYVFLAKKYKLKPLERHIWKFMRLRPNNFPTIRIAQFGHLLAKEQGLLTELLHAKSVKAYYKLLNCDANDYWANHYRFNISSRQNIRSKKLGQNSKNLIILNTIVPLLFAYGKQNGLPEYQDKALHLLEHIKAEQNSIISKWKSLNIVPKNAFESQALIYLYNNYCNVKKCLSCRIGHQILTKNE